MAAGRASSGSQQLHDSERGLKENDANYAVFYDTRDGWQESTLFPSVVGVLSVEECYKLSLNFNTDIWR